MVAVTAALRVIHLDTSSATKTATRTVELMDWWTDIVLALRMAGTTVVTMAVGAVGGLDALRAVPLVALTVAMTDVLMAGPTVGRTVADWADALVERLAAQ